MNRTPVYDMPVKTGLVSSTARVETASYLSLVPQLLGFYGGCLCPAAWVVAPGNGSIAMVTRVATMLLSL